MTKFVRLIGKTTIIAMTICFYNNQTVQLNPQCIRFSLFKRPQSSLTGGNICTTEYTILKYDRNLKQFTLINICKTISVHC